MRALVTGASGFVGQWLCAALVERGDSVTGTAVEVGADGIPPVRSDLRAAVQWMRVDLRDREDMARLLDEARPELVFHLAGVTFVPTASADPGHAYEVNVVASARLLSEIAARKAAGTIDPVVLVVGSGEQYGRHETAHPLTEVAEQRPLTVYGATKAAQEIAALQTWRMGGVRVVCTRSFNHTGPDQPAHLLVPALVRRALALRGVPSPRLAIGNTTPIRDFLHVADAVQAYLFLAERGTSGEAYNVSSGVGRSVGELARLILDRVGVRAELEPVGEYIRPVDLPVLVGDSTKLREATAWRPRSGIEHAIDQMIDAASR
jgi:GDP-4-dehydro-6-deoxy-D-mannose reductase